MGECICSSCKNLKSVFDDEGAEAGCECVHGFPSESCAECATGECELTCANYVSDEEPDNTVVVKCDACGKELLKACADEAEGRMLCVDCYLKEG